MSSASIDRQTPQVSSAGGAVDADSTLLGSLTTTRSDTNAEVTHRRDARALPSSHPLSTRGASGASLTPDAPAVFSGPSVVPTAGNVPSLLDPLVGDA